MSKFTQVAHIDLISNLHWGLVIIDGSEIKQVKDGQFDELTSHLKLHYPGVKLQIRDRDMSDYSQVCIWPGTICTRDKIAEFEKFMLDELDARVKFLECTSTLPDADQYGYAIPDTGGRVDLIFAVHRGDISRFSVRRLAYSIRWIEDELAAVNTSGRSIHLPHISQYKSWTTSATQGE